MKKLFLFIVVVLLTAVFTSFQTAVAAPPRQDGEEDAHADDEVIPTKDCQECHLDVAAHWEDSSHANAYKNEAFQEEWQSQGEPTECLACHTTNYNPATGEYEAEGVSCESCHGEVTGQHPPMPVPILADSEYCGSCHTTSLSEWHRSAHAAEDIGCMDCHDPHSQGKLFETTDELCLNCHNEDERAEMYLEDLHVENGVGCMDCHSVVLPLDPPPDDGIVPTGHAFGISAATCVACHTDSLHAGEPLPGYEEGTLAHNGAITQTETFTPTLTLASTDHNGLSLEQQIQALETSIASNNVTMVFQGAIVGLVLGGTTAWIISQNIRARRRKEEEAE